ncbi:MAG: rane protein [Oscillospiraceae bacterium]|nr:rane protein [Oscillospiraceae bacterium]
MAHMLGRQKIRDLILGIVLLIATMALLLFPKEAIEAGKTGLTLCYNVIIPSLFPFFVLSSLVVELGLSGYLGRALERVMRPLFNVPGCCASAVALGFVGGYPVGAQTAIHLYEKGSCTKEEAERLLSFCNNSGPAFILGVVGAGVFSNSKIGITLYFAHAAASICVGILFRFYHRSSGRHRGRPVQNRIEVTHFTAAFVNSIKSALNSALNICAFVVFFTVVLRLLFLSGVMGALAGALAAVFSPIGFTQEWAERFLTGVLEISSGVWSVSGTGSLSGRMSMAAFILGWAGISVHCQVLSFLGSSGLSPRSYLIGKLLHGVISAALVFAVTHIFSFQAPVSVYLADQVDAISSMEFSAAIAISVVAAWVVFLIFFFIAALTGRKKSGKRTASVISSMIK